MKNLVNTKKGFSLVELLIVIAIVGILSTAIMSNLNTGRARSYDSKIKQQLVSFRTSAYVYYYNQTPNSFGTAGNCNTGIFADMTTANGRPGSFLATNNLPAYATVQCSSNGTSYAVKASLYSGDEYFCVDSTGAGKTITGAIGSAVTVCP